MALIEELERAGAVASAHGEVSGVLAAESVTGGRAYLIALGEGEARTWLVLDEALVRVDDRALVREIASVVVLCELAAELAGGGRLEELRAELVRLRMTEQPEGIEGAEEAALELERVIGAPPRVASPAYLDEVGTATRALEHALGEHESPFANALASATGTVEAFVAEVESRQALPLR